MSMFGLHSCVVCGRLSPSVIFCSRRCEDTVANQGPEMRDCLVCGRSFDSVAAVQTIGVSSICSASCLTEWREGSDPDGGVTALDDSEDGPKGYYKGE